jgi:hypothetical protein
MTFILRTTEALTKEEQHHFDDKLGLMKSVMKKLIAEAKLSGILHCPRSIRRRRSRKCMMMSLLVEGFHALATC